jgi:integrase
MACLYDKNPAMGRSKLVKARKVQHRPYLTEKQLSEFLEKLDNYKTRGRNLAPLALKLLLLTFVRPGELLNAKWNEFNMERSEWIIPAERMKMKRPHIVPLSTQAIKVFEILRPLAEKSQFVFPSRHVWKKPVSPAFLKEHLIAMGYIGENKFVPHGARATASTILNERVDFRPDVIERQLAHVERNKVRAAYHRSEYLADRKAMMQWWGDYLDNCRKQ